MTQISFDTQKPKRAPSRQTGCMKLLLIPILLALACYGGMWLFARYGGEWATSNQIPIPPGSELVNVLLPDVENGTYITHHSVYLHSWTHEELRTWFEQETILFWPRCADVPEQGGVNCKDESGPYLFGSLEKHVSSDPHLRLYWISIFYTVLNVVSIQGWNPIPVAYLNVSIYESQENFDNTFVYPSQYLDISVPDIDIPEGKIAFSVRTFTPRRIGWWFDPLYDR